MGFLRFLAIRKKKIKDPYSKEHFTWKTMMVPHPTYEDPIPCVLVTLRSGHRKVMMRFESIEAYERAFALSGEEAKELDAGIATARAHSAALVQRMKIAEELIKNAKPGDRIVNMDTGELLSEIEKYLKGKGDGK